MKKLMVLLMAMAMMVSFAACGDTKKPESSSNSTSSTAMESSDVSQEESSEEDANTADGAGDVGDYYVEILSMDKTTDYQDTEAVIVNFTFTNNSDSDTSFLVAISAKAFQDGVELDTGVIMGDDYDANLYMKDIKPGASIEVQRAYTLNDSTTPVLVECSELITFTDTGMVSKEFTLE